jgi:hypothetical protein
LAGTVGTGVRTGVVDVGITAYRFPDVAPDTLPTRPDHLVTVPSDPSLDPGDGAFAVTVRFRTTSGSSNIVQKGQRFTGGGYWKVEQDDGRMRCVFLDGQGRGVPAFAGGRPIDDGEWHTVTCRRTPTSVTMWIDYENVARVRSVTGAIGNDWPMTIGGKPRCDQVWVECDYFTGDIDFVRVKKA